MFLPLNCAVVAAGALAAVAALAIPAAGATHASIIHQPAMTARQPAVTGSWLIGADSGAV